MTSRERAQVLARFLDRVGAEAKALVRLTPQRLEILHRCKKDEETQ